MQQVGQNGVFETSSSRRGSNRALALAVGAVSVVAMGTAAMAVPVVMSAIAPEPSASMAPAPKVDRAHIAAFVSETQLQLASAQVPATVFPVQPVQIQAQDMPGVDMSATPEILVLNADAADTVKPMPRNLPAPVVAPAATVLAMAPYTQSQTVVQPAKASAPDSDASRKRLLNRWSMGEFR